MTCINFFTGTAGSRSNVQNCYFRLPYLNKANKHLETYLSLNRSHVSQSHRASASRSESGLRGGSIYDAHAESVEPRPVFPSGPRLLIAPGDAQKQIETIKLQVLVTTYLYTCEMSRGTAVQSVTRLKGSLSGADQPVTLFERNSRLSVVAQVLSCVVINCL